MITEKAWQFATRDWVAGCILDCIRRKGAEPTRETTLYSIILGYNRTNEEGKSYPSWATLAPAGRKNFLEIAIRALLRRGQIIFVGTTKDYRAEEGVTRLYELGTILDRLAKAVDLPPLGVSDAD